MLKGITIKLYEKQQTGTDSLNKPVYEEVPVDIENVLVGLPTETEVLNTLNLYGKKVVYTLAIPKGDTHEWEDRKIELPEPFAGIYHTAGPVIAGIEAMVPGPWNKQIKVGKYG